MIEDAKNTVRYESERVGFRDLTMPLQILVVFCWIWTAMLLLTFFVGVFQGVYGG